MLIVLPFKSCVTGCVKSRIDLVKHLLKLKHKYYRLSKSDPSFKLSYKHYEGLYKKAVLQHTEKVESNVILSNNHNQLYKFINKKLKSPGCLPPILDEQGQPILESTTKANLFNDNFVKVFQTDDGNQPLLSNLPELNSITSMCFHDITNEEVRRSIDALKSSFSRTPDNIPSFFYKTDI